MAVDYIHEDDATARRRRAVEEQDRLEYDPETIRQSRRDANQAYQVAVRLREIALEAFRQGRFNDVVGDDQESLVLVLEYATHAASGNLAKWIAIDQHAREKRADASTPDQD